jgi:hypothetical protein
MSSSSPEEGQICFHGGIQIVTGLRPVVLFSDRWQEQLKPVRSGRLYILHRGAKHHGALRGGGPGPGGLPLPPAILRLRDNMEGDGVSSKYLAGLSSAGRYSLSVRVETRPAQPSCSVAGRPAGAWRGRGSAPSPGWLGPGACWGPARDGPGGVCGDGLPAAGAALDRPRRRL